jgi:hypothetical protein
MSELSNSPAGWYPDPTGKPGQSYWDGSAWIVAQPQAQYGGGAARLGPSVFATNAMAVYSLALGGFSIPLNILCFMGAALGLPALGVGIIAFKKSEQLGGVGRGMAIGGIVCAAIGSAISIIGYLVFGSMMSGWSA